MVMVKQFLAVFLLWNVCQGTSAACANCEKCQSEEYCEECKPGFYLHGIDCKQCPSDCKKCKNDRICTECNDGLYGVKCENECFNCINSVCDIYSGKCKVGCKNASVYAVKTVDGFRCHSCHRTCERCKPGYERECYTCKTGYWGPFCQHKCISGCFETSCGKLDGRCDKGCKDGFYPVNGNFTLGCNKCHDNCLICSTEKACSKCRSEFWGQTCGVLCRENCSSKGCDKSTGNCYCKPGHFRTSNGSCAPCPSFCEKCFSTDVCETCQPGRYGNRCDRHCGPVCKECLNTANTCTDCHTGWTLFNFTCTKQQPVCPQGEYLSATGFCLNCQPGCFRCSSPVHCLECLENYFMNSTGVCSVCPENCSDGTCEFEECQSQYKTDFSKTLLHTIIWSGLGLLTVVFIVAVGFVLIRDRQRRSSMTSGWPRELPPSLSHLKIEETWLQ